MQYGTLYPLCDKWEAIKLFAGEEISVGRSKTCSYLVSAKQVGDFCVKVSKVQFAVNKKPDGCVYLKDMSTNGTFINENKKVGKGRERRLTHEDEIKIADKTVYLFISNNKEYHQNNAYPEEVREKYDISKQLGNGACGVVRLAFRKSDGQRFAIKSIDKRKMEAAGVTMSLKNEVKVMKAIDHPCVIRMEDTIDTVNTLFIILELADGGELFQKIVDTGPMPEDKAKLLFYQLLSAIQYLHSKKIVHRDLKPENILLHSNDDEPLVKISDMGLSKLAINTQLKTFCGTPHYLAPEMIVNRVRHDGYSSKVDMWSLGVVLYTLLGACTPFDQDREDKPMMKQILDGDYSFRRDRFGGVSEQAKDLVRNLMKVDFTKRFSADEALKDPWLNDDKVVAKAKILMGFQPDIQNSPPMGPPPAKKAKEMPSSK